MNFSNSKTLSLCVALATSLFVFSAPSHAASNQRLAKLEAADQADRDPGLAKIDWNIVSKRDASRRQEVLQVLASGQIKTADDYLDAAIIFQHGDTVQDIQMAYSFASIACQLNPTSRNAMQLKADAWDRIMIKSGKPQWYGTQFERSKTTGKLVMFPTDPDAVSDLTRKAMGLPTLAETQAMIAKANMGK